MGRSDYDVTWAVLCDGPPIVHCEWYEKGYYKHYHFEVLKGNSTVMFKLEFIDGRKHAQTQTLFKFRFDSFMY